MHIGWQSRDTVGSACTHCDLWVFRSTVIGYGVIHFECFSALYKNKMTLAGRCNNITSLYNKMALSMKCFQLLSYLANLLISLMFLTCNEASNAPLESFVHIKHFWGVIYILSLCCLFLLNS